MISKQVLVNKQGIMVLLERFELSASPLPRECSTPELQWHLAKQKALSLERGPIAIGGWAVQAAILRLSQQTDDGGAFFVRLFSV